MKRKRVSYRTCIFYSIYYTDNIENKRIEESSNSALKMAVIGSHITSPSHTSLFFLKMIGIGSHTIITFLLLDCCLGDIEFPIFGFSIGL